MEQGGPCAPIITCLCVCTYAIVGSSGIHTDVLRYGAYCVPRRVNRCTRQLLERPRRVLRSTAPAPTHLAAPVRSIFPSCACAGKLENVEINCRGWKLQTRSCYNYVQCVMCALISTRYSLRS